MFFDFIRCNLRNTFGTDRQQRTVIYILDANFIYLWRNQTTDDFQFEWIKPLTSGMLKMLCLLVILEFTVGVKRYLKGFGIQPQLVYNGAKMTTRGQLIITNKSNRWSCRNNVVKVTVYWEDCEHIFASWQPQRKFLFNSLTPITSFKSKFWGEWRIAFSDTSSLAGVVWFCSIRIPNAQRLKLSGIDATGTKDIL